MTSGTTAAMVLLIPWATSATSGGHSVVIGDGWSDVAQFWCIFVVPCIDTLFVSPVASADRVDASIADGKTAIGPALHERYAVGKVSLVILQVKLALLSSEKTNAVTLVIPSCLTEPSGLLRVSCKSTSGLESPCEQVNSTSLPLGTVCALLMFMLQRGWWSSGRNSISCSFTLAKARLDVLDMYVTSDMHWNEPSPSSFKALRIESISVFASTEWSL